jgi:drug/metabolite transporter (DMT)-like permease
MFSPSAFDWTNRDAVLGNGLLLLSALAWSVSILYTRAHHWIATPFQLVYWQALLAAILLTILALIIEGELHIVWSNTLIMWFAYSGLVGRVHSARNPRRQCNDPARLVEQGAVPRPRRLPRSRP